MTKSNISLMYTRPRRVPFAVDVRKYEGLKIDRNLPSYEKDREQFVKA